MSAWVLGCMAIKEVDGCSGGPGLRAKRFGIYHGDFDQLLAIDCSMMLARVASGGLRMKVKIAFPGTIPW